MHVDAATAAMILFHKRSFDHRAKDAWDDEKTFLRVFIRWRRRQQFLVPVIAS
jgi:hypothetical protein